MASETSGGKPVAPSASLSLPAPSALRDRADRVSQKAGRKGSPRRRYLRQQIVKVSVRLLPTLAVIAAIDGVISVSDALSGKVPRAATITGVGLAIFLGACSLSVPLATARDAPPRALRDPRKRVARDIPSRALFLLNALAASASAVTLLGWGYIARLTGGPSSPYLLGLPLTSFAMTAIVPIDPRVATITAAAAYAGLLVASPFGPLHAHLLVLAAGGVGIFVARTRRRISVNTFRRLERHTAAVSRMRRVQEQLVVVEKLEALRVLVGGMAHELNNALAISVASNAQAQRSLENDAAAALAAIKRSDGGLQRIRRTVDRLRRFAMAAEGVLEPADVGAMLDFALESAIGRARSGVIIERAYDPAVGAIECHVSALAEALFQIARNAVEAMPGGGTIHATVRNEGDRVVLSVADEGGGIPPDQIAHVFDPFYSRGGKGAASKSGLGLSAVYGLVSALGGRVDIQSAVGKGTEVAIVMPRREAKSKPPPP